MVFIDSSGHAWTMTVYIEADREHIRFGGRWKSFRDARNLYVGQAITFGTSVLGHSRNLYVKMSP